MNTVLLVILDGWGIGKKDATNPIYTARLQNIEYIKRNFLAGSLQSAGIAVGLPWSEEGNSEIGHLTIGAGKILYQHYPRISAAIRNGSFFKNEILAKAFEHAKKNNGAVNFAGLLTEANVHASLEHFLALIKFAQESGIQKINLHLFADGKDSSPKSLMKLIKQLPLPPATVSGRHFALDRDSHWDRTEQAYKVMIGNGLVINDVEEHARSFYDRGLTDQMIEPVIAGLVGQQKSVQDGDVLVFFDFREDSIRQIAEAFIGKNFDKFPVKKFSNLHIVTMTKYADRFDVPVAFPPEAVEKPLGLVLAENKKYQLRIAETEKYAHITYFFNGYKDKPFENEARILVPSKKAARYDEYPEMMAAAVTDNILEALASRSFDFILANYANADIIAHTGNFVATLEAVKTADLEVGRLLKAILDNDAVMVITSDHGNAENLVEMPSYLPQTKHDPNPVPIYIIGQKFKTTLKNDAIVNETENRAVGLQSDVAPTVLELMDISKPPEMTGQSLIKLLR